MRVVIFFQFLILFLLKSGDSAHAAVAPAHIGKYVSALSNQSTTPFSSLNRNHTYIIIISYTELADQIEDLVTEDVEEDECSNSFIRRSNSPERNYSTQLYSSPSGDPIRRSKAAQCFYGRISYKYIQQRVLRVWSSATQMPIAHWCSRNEITKFISCNKCWRWILRLPVISYSLLSTLIANYYY